MSQLESRASFVSRLFFFVAFLLLAIAVFDRFLNLFGFTILEGSYSPGRMLQYAGIMLVFVIALLLRDIREELRRGKP